MQRSAVIEAMPVVPEAAFNAVQASSFDNGLPTAISPRGTMEVEDFAVADRMPRSPLFTNLVFAACGVYSSRHLQSSIADR